MPLEGRACFWCATGLLAASWRLSPSRRSGPVAGSATTGSPHRATPASAAVPLARQPCPRPPGAAAEQALVQKYCVTCHNARAMTGGLSLDGLNPAEAATHADVWEKVAMKLRGGMMPPVGMPRPDEATLRGFATSLESASTIAGAAARRTRDTSRSTA